MSVETKVHDLLDGVVSAAGLELIDVEYAGGSLRVTVDSDDGGVTTEQLAEVNRLVSPILDQHDPVPGRYLLEVSSPGLERPLRTEAHYARAVGEQVVVKRGSGHEPRRLRGSLVSIDGDEVTVDAVEIDGVDLDETVTHTVDRTTITSARTVFEWGPKPKPGQPKGGKAAGGKAAGGKKKKSSK